MGKVIDSIKKIADRFENCITIADIDLPGRPLIFVNGIFTQVTGYTYEESVGHNCNFLQGKLTSDKKVQFMREALNAKKALCVDVVNYKKNKTPFWNRLIMVPINDGGHNYYMGLQNDVTALKGKSNREEDLEQIKEGQICHYINNPLHILTGYQDFLDNIDLTPEKIADIENRMKARIKQLDNYIVGIQDFTKLEDIKSRLIAIGDL